MSKIYKSEIYSMTKEQNYMRGYRDGKSDILNKIRAEIEFEVDHRTNMLCAEDVFQIIDKYMVNHKDKDKEQEEDKDL